ncbi:MAG: response regulator [Thermoleophilaceae bacterium]|nr:response regulator [Thermoleophilaceae bacterium]
MATLNESAGAPAGSLLLIDDEPQQRDLLVRSLADRYDCATAANAAAARELMEETDFDLIICDLEMPGESGLDLLREIPALQPDAAVIMVTGTNDVQTAETALEFGAYGYIVKPYRRVELIINVENALRRRALEIARRDYTGRLESQLMNKTSDLSSALSDLEAERVETLRRLCLAVEARDHVTAAHIDGMVQVVERFARKLGYSDVDAKTLGWASAMHDVGKIGVPDHILLKPGPLSTDERTVMMEHAEIGHHMLSGSPNPMLRIGSEIARCHHERWDGTGYPRGLAGEEIPMAARIVQIVDVLSAMTNDRPYRKALPTETAIQELADGAGTQFDPELVKVFLDNYEEIMR